MLIQGVQRIRETLDGVVELNGSEVEARGRDDGCSHGGWRIRHREPVLSAVCDGNLLLGSTFAYGQHVCIWAARLDLRHRESDQSFNAAGDRTLVGFWRSKRDAIQYRTLNDLAVTAGNRCLRVNAFASAVC